MKKRKKVLGVPIELIGPGTKVFDQWDTLYHGVDNTNVYGTKQNIQLLFEHLEITKGIVTDVCSGSRTVIPDIPTIRGFAIEVDLDFLDEAERNYRTSINPRTPPIQFQWADVSVDPKVPQNSCVAVIWNGDVVEHLKKYALELNSGASLVEEGLADEETAKEQMVDRSLVNSHNLLGKGGVLIATGENSLEVYERAKRLKLKVARLTIVGREFSNTQETREVRALVLHKP